MFDIGGQNIRSISLRTVSHGNGGDEIIKMSIDGVMFQMCVHRPPHIIHASLSVSE